MKPGALIRTLLVALPAGLLLLGVGAMVMTHVKRESQPADPNEAIRLEAASLKRRPVNPDDLKRDLATLGEKIGARHAEKAGGLDSAAYWLESTLGGGNIGYVVERQPFEAGGREFRNLIAELPGRERRREIVLVGVAYDTPPADSDVSGRDAAVAALLSLARAFTGDAQERTVRFAAFANSAAPEIPLAERGAAHYAARGRARGETIVASLFLDYLARGGASAPVRFAGGEDSIYFVDSAKGAFHHHTGREVKGLPPSPGDETVLAPAAAAFGENGYVAVSVREEDGSGLDTSPALANREEALAETVRGLEAIVRVWANP